MNPIPFSDDVAAAQIKECLSSLYPLIKNIEEERVRSEFNLNNISKAHDKITQEEKVSPYYQQKLKTLYESAVQDAFQEETLIRTALDKISEIRRIENERRLLTKNVVNKEALRKGTLFKILNITAQTLPLFVGKIGEKAPPLCGAIPADPNYIAKPGDMVAALVKGKNENIWILAEVVHFNIATNKYDVDDIEVEEEQKERHTLSKSKVVPLPLMRANPETEAYALFPKNSLVMALYPQTTCFYKAFVDELPTTALEQYKLIFEDARCANGYSLPISVPQRYIFSYKDKKGKNC